MLFQALWLLQSVKGACELTVKLYNSLDECVANEASARVSGTITPNGQCNRVEGSSSSELPGNYVAECRDGSTVEFLKAGCTSNSCSSTSIASDQDAGCDQDRSKEGFLYVYSDPTYELSSSNSWQCYDRWYEYGSTYYQIFFAIYGDCSSDCTDDEPVSSPETPEPSPESTPEPAPDPTPKPTPEPTPNPTPQPVAPAEPDPTPPPTPQPIQRPTSAPQSPSTPKPSTTTTDTSTLTPSKKPVTPPTTNAPATPPDYNGNGDSTASEPPSRSPSTPVPSPENSAEIMLVRDQIEAALRFIPMNLTVPNTTIWENVTKAYMQKNAENQGISIVQININNVNQKLLTPDVVVGTEDDLRHRFLRSLEQTKQPSLLISFDLDVSYKLSPSSSTNTQLPTVSELVKEAFDTELERSRYLLELIRKDRSFESVTTVEILVNSTVDDDISINQPSKNGGTGAVIAGSVVGTIAIVSLIAAMAFFLTRKRHSGTHFLASKVGSRTPQSNTSSSNEMLSDSNEPLQQKSEGRDSNEILLDDLCVDDISTLGPGSFFAGQNNMETIITIPMEERTAVLSLDYDYIKDQCRSVGGLSSDTVQNLSKLGLLSVDDGSFSKQYALESLEDEEVDGMRVTTFSVRAPPGLLGMIVASSKTGGVPVVQNIKEDSVLRGRVLIGDRLISVDNEDVSTMATLEVSRLISSKQNQQRTLVFVRIAKPGEC